MKKTRIGTNMLPRFAAAATVVTTLAAPLAVTAEGEENSVTNKVVFGVISDTHVGGTQTGTATQEQRLNTVLDWYSDSEQGLDAMAVVGDITDGNTAAQWNAASNSVANHLDPNIVRMFTMGNHDNNGYDNFEAATGCKANEHYVVNGYHFIAISPGLGDIDETTRRPSTLNNGNYTTDWLTNQLALAEADGTDKPIFVFFHHPVRNTFYVSDTWYTTSFGTGTGCIFTNHPRVVTFSGHIHSPNNDPRSIWQDGGFTAVNTATTYYYEMEKNYIGNAADPTTVSSLPKDNTQAMQGLLVTAEGSTVEIKNYDFIAGQFLEQTWTFDVTKPLPYTAARADKGQKPVFTNLSETAVSGRIALTNFTAKTVTAVFPQAFLPAPSEVGEVVHSYKFDLYDTAAGKLVRTAKQWSDFMHVPMQPDYSQVIGGLTPGVEYELRVYALGSFQKTSDQYLTVSFVAGTGGCMIESGTLASATGKKMELAAALADAKAVADSGTGYTASSLVRLQAAIAAGEAASGDPALTHADAKAAISAINAALRQSESVADILDVDFEGAFACDKSERQLALITSSGATFTYDDTLGKYVANINGASQAYRTDLLTTNDYARFTAATSIEAVFKYEASSANMDILSNTQGAGQGLEVTPQKKLQYYLSAGGYVTPLPESAVLETGRWYHVVGTFDGASRTAKLYINGEQVASGTSSKTAMDIPAEVSRRYVIGGDINGSGNVELPFKGAISAARLYSGVLSAAQIAALSAAGLANHGHGQDRVASAATRTKLFDEIANAKELLVVQALRNAAGLEELEKAIGVAAWKYGKTVLLEQEAQAALAALVQASINCVRTSVRANLLDVDFQDMIVTDKSPRGLTFTTTSGANFTHDAQLNKYVANFTGNAAQCYMSETLTTADYNLIQEHTSIEAVFKFQGIAGNVIGNEDSAGQGIEITSGGSVQYWINTGGSYAVPVSTAQTKGEWHHAVGTYDGATQTAKLYIDGKLVDTKPTTAAIMKIPGTAARKYVLGGDVASGGGVQAPFNGVISELRVYGLVLDAQEARVLSAAGLGDHGQDKLAPDDLRAALLARISEAQTLALKPRRYTPESFAVLAEALALAESSTRYEKEAQTALAALEAALAALVEENKGTILLLR